MRLPSTIVGPDGVKRQNPEWYKWYRQNLSDEKRRKRKEQGLQHYHANKQAHLGYKAKYRGKNRGKLRRDGRRYYQRTKEHKLAHEKERRQQPEVKAYYQRWCKKHEKMKSETNAKTYQKARILRQKGKKTKRKPGFVYFFKSITSGYYKAGCTTNWTKRKMAYSGPAAVARLYFCRPVPDMFYAETQLKIFLENAGYEPCGKSNRKRQCDWFVLRNDPSNVV